MTKLDIYQVNDIIPTHYCISLRYFARLFGEVIFLYFKKNKDNSYHYYIVDGEAYEGVYEIRYDVFIHIMDTLKELNNGYWNKIMDDLEELQ